MLRTAMLKKAATTLAMLAIALLVVAPAAASEEIGRTTGQKCTACHDKPGSKRLTDEGKYYDLMHSLDGYDQIKTSFGKCTACHVSKPGSTKLTKKGTEFAELVKDMDGLRTWLQERHPAPAVKE